MTEAAYIIRKMTVDDTFAVAEIEKECFSSPWTVQGLLSETDNPSAEFFVLEEKGIVAAYMGMHIVLDECYIANVAVKGSCRKRGYGQRLVENALETAKNKGCFFITLEVRASNSPAISLYEKCGFERVGERKDFYSSPKENAIIMTKYF